MAITIKGVPEFITRDQYVEFFRALGVDPHHTVELRAAHDGIHAIVHATFADGSRRVDPNTSGYYKHRIFIPIRDHVDDARTTRVTEVRDRPVTRKENDL